jgi:hypothetical protein
MTEEQYKAIQRSLTKKLKDVEIRRSMFGSSNFRDGYKEGILVAKSVLSAEYKLQLKKEEQHGKD